MRKYLLLGLTFLFFVLLLPILGGCMQFRMNNKDLEDYFTKKSFKPKIKTFEALDREIRYLEVGADTMPTVFFVHGAPGGLDAFKHLMTNEELVSKARMVSVDRPGYGYSGFGKSEVSIEKQSAMFKPLLETLVNGKPIIIIGHSYGGTMVARMAMDYPELIDSVIMVAAAIDPENERFFWFNKPADWLLVRWMVPRSLRVANDEKLSHVSELKKMLPNWEQITLPVTIIHGKKDGLVPPENAYFGQKQLVNADLDFQMYEDVNHLVLWNKPELIKDAILKYLE